MIARAVFTIALTCASLEAVTIDTLANCRSDIVGGLAPETHEDSGPSACSVLSGFSGNVSISVHTSITMAGGLVSEFDMAVNDNQFRPPPFGAESYNWYPTAFASMTYSGRTTGPLRVGLLQFSTAGDYFGIGSATLSDIVVGNTTVSVTVHGFPYCPESPCGGFIPIQLGAPLRIGVEAFAQGLGGTAESGLGGAGDYSVFFRAFEADGLTPVRIVGPVPEPSALLLFVGGLAALGFARRWHR